MGNSGERDSIAAKLAQLGQVYLMKLPSMVSIIEEALPGLNRGDTAEASVAEATKHAHRIAGTSGSYGFSDISAAAREVELAGASLAQRFSQGLSHAAAESQIEGLRAKVQAFRAAVEAEISRSQTD